MLRRSLAPLVLIHICAVLLVSLGVVPAFSDPPGAARRAPPASIITGAAHIRVFDGDTFRDTASGVTYRIENIDTPESGERAHCDAERAHAYRATRAVRALLRNASELEIRPTGRTDRYDRTIALVSINGRDLGATLIAADLARPWRGRREPWCDARGRLIV